MFWNSSFHLDTGWLKKMDSISYANISWIIHGMWMMYIKFKRGSLRFQIPALERSPSAQPCSSVGWDQNGYYAAQDFFLRVSEENVRRIQESFERSSGKSTRRASRELGILQPTVWRVLRRRLLFNWVHLFESSCVLRRYLEPEVMFHGCNDCKVRVRNDALCRSPWTSTQCVTSS